MVLPIGISFFTFEAIAYLIEVRRGTTEPLALLDFATYLSFFPKLISGPITRPSEFIPQFRDSPQGGVEAPRAFVLIARGLFKKMVVATYLADTIVDGLFATPNQYSAGEGTPWHLRVHRTDIPRFLRLHRHGNRSGTTARIHAA